MAGSYPRLGIAVAGKLRDTLQGVLDERPRHVETPCAEAWQRCDANHLSFFHLRIGDRVAQLGPGRQHQRGRPAYSIALPSESCLLDHRGTRFAAREVPLEAFAIQTGLLSN